MKADWMNPELTELSILKGTKTLRDKSKCDSNSSNCSSDEGISISASESTSSNDSNESNDD